jgi:predicted nucleotidyltransferase
MAHFYESTLIDTVDGFQCKSYSNEHPEGYVIVKPKYIPKEAISGNGLRHRFLFERCMVRFNQFAQKEKLAGYVRQFRERFPDYIYDCSLHKTWFYAVPRNKIKTVHDGRKGLQELLSVPEKDLDDYLGLVRELVELLSKSGVKPTDLGITHSTLLGNYTIGKSDIDIIIYGKDNGWKVLNFLKKAKHELLRWKSDEEWAAYYREHKTAESRHFTEEEYVKHMRRKRYEGMFGNTVFTLFTVEEEGETWFKWGATELEPLGIATVKGTVSDHYNSHVRAGCYEVKDAELVQGERPAPKIDSSIPIKRIVTYSIPFVQQALSGETITACGRLELAKPAEGEPYYRIVVGYFDAYLNERRELEFIKAEI